MKLPTAEEMFEETVQKVSSSPEEWLKFLNTASRVYQYDFDDQLMNLCTASQCGRLYKFLKSGKK